VHHEQDIARMGGLRQHAPVVFWTFLVGAAALSGLPLITSGFYSKDWILWSVYSSPQGGPWLWAGGALGTGLTALYSFRLVFRVFFGERRTEPSWIPGPAITVPLVVLAALSLTVGFLEVPRTLGQVTLFSDYLSHTLPSTPHSTEAGESAEAGHQIAVTVASLSGIAVAAWFFLRRRSAETAAPRPMDGTVAQFWFEGWGFDRLYDALLIRPWQALTREQADRVDLLYEGVADALRGAHHWLTFAQTGKVRWYVASVGIAALLMLGFFTR
jgi:NADH-quinone oxidoreductase subunit L